MSSGRRLSVLLGVLLILVATTARTQTPPEYLVAVGINPIITHNPVGGVLVCYQKDAHPVKRLFVNFGTPAFEQELAWPPTGDENLGVDIAIGDNTNAMIAWQLYGATGLEITYATVFNPVTGQLVSPDPEIYVGSNVGVEDARVINDSYGGFLVANSIGSNFTDTRIKVFRFAPDGTVSQTDTVTTGLGSLTRFDIGALDDGGYIVAYAGNPTGGYPRVLTRRYDATGAPAGPAALTVDFTPSNGQVNDIRVATHSDGRHTVLWSVGGSAGAQAMGADGTTIGNRIDLGAADNFGGMDAGSGNGVTFVVWVGANDNILLATIDTNGSTTSPIQVNVSPAFGAPRVAVAQAGVATATIIWPGQLGIYGRQFPGPVAVRQESFGGLKSSFRGKR